MDYEKMYFTLFHKITDTITELQEIQRKTEELYVSSCVTCSEDDHT